VEKNRTIKGTGLGLTISKFIIEIMGGNITVESVYDQGTTFNVEIQKTLGDATQIHRTDEKMDAIYAPDAKVLIVDDNEVNLTVALELLRLYDIASETATSGKEAIELINQNQYDFVLMDHMMPEVDGIEATRIIRKIGLNVPIIALTANAVSGVKEMLLEAGMNDYLSKPIIRSELTDILKKWIPSEKLLCPLSRQAASSKDRDEEYKEMQNRIRQIDGLSVSIGLERVDAQWDIYEKMLKLMMQEIEKACKNLGEFLLANDMNSFYIEVHGIKGALANIGAMELSERAFDLEVAASVKDIVFCVDNLPHLLERLGILRSGLKEAFSVNSSGDAVLIPPELPGIFERLKNAFAETDLMLIDKEVEILNSLGLAGVLGGEVEKIKDMVMMMNYEEATEQMLKLLDSTQCLDSALVN
jgi:CheY-like chemotaxis protein/HPt (histidine-containing phosphotransfer) domain-containing protein